MPQVKTYGGPRVAREAIPNARRRVTETAESFGAGFGDAAASIGLRFLERQTQQAQDNADEVALVDFDRQQAEWEHGRLNDAQTGVLNTVKGKDAYGLSASIGEEYDTFAGKLLNTLNPRQRQAAQRLSLRRRTAIIGALDDYAGRQGTIYEQATTSGALNNSVSLAVANAANPARVAEEHQRQQVLVAGYADRQGLSPEARAQLSMEWSTKTHVGVIDQLLASDRAGDAQHYFEAARDQIDGQALPDIEKKLHAGSVLGAAQQASDEIRRVGGTLGARLEQVRTIDDSEVRQRTQGLVEHDWEIEQASELQGRRELMVSIRNTIDKGGLRAVPSTVWSTLTADEVENFERYAKRNAAGGEASTNLVMYYDLLKQAATDPKRFSALNLGEPKYLNGLGKTELKHVFDLQADLLKGDKPKADEKLARFRTNTQIINQTLDAAKISDKSTRLKFWSQVNDKVTAVQQLTGKNVDDKDVQQLADDLLMSVVLKKGSWWNALPGGAPLFDTKKRLMDITVEDIPADERRQAEEALRKYGEPVTDEGVLDLYLQVKRNNAISGKR